MFDIDVAVGTPEISAREFALIKSFAYETFGLDLRDGKEKLVSARLGKHMRAGGFKNFEEYLKHVRVDKSGAAITTLIDALTTNHTSFLREQEHFRFLKSDVLPALKGRSRVTVWSAASSTGEEPYSILFTLVSELCSGAGPDVRVLASDISTRVLQTGKAGVYAADRVAGLPPEWLTRFFVRTRDGGSSTYTVKPEFRSRIEFRRVNLMERLPAGESFPVIFCRNVMIYFNKATQTDLVNRLSACLEPGGYLFVGHAESLTGIAHRLKYVKPAIYQKCG